MTWLRTLLAGLALSMARTEADAASATAEGNACILPVRPFADPLAQELEELPQ